ncbi:MAG: hypothetical protein H6553_06205 [Chitinophagales bacterium]|nr:hypothetical protein [Chitinophagales bacterium]
MKYLFLTLLFTPLFFSCKKEKSHFDSLKNSSWTTYYQYNGFNFYASSNLRLSSDFSCSDIGLVDTIVGSWQYQEEKLNITLENSTIIVASFISNDSLSGTIKNGVTSGVWSAKRD